MASVPSLWIDVTDLVLWEQRTTGTQRVIHDVIAAYAQLREVRLAYFSQRLSQFFEVDVARYLRAADDVERAGQVGRVVSRSAFLRPLVYSPPKRASFERADALLVLGGDWRRRNFLGALARIRSKPGVAIHHFVHDVMPITTPHLFPPHETEACRRYLVEAFNIVDSIITSSYWNAHQIKMLMDEGALRRQTVHRVGLGVGSLNEVDPQRPKVPVEPGEFTLSVGTFELKKNRRALYQAHKLALKAGIDLLPTVVAGQPGGIQDQGVYLLEHDPALRGLAFILRDVTDSQLAWLYRNAAKSVFSSLSEGWGLPIGESLALGTPCLSSNTSAMPEVGEGSAEYFDPNDPTELLELLVANLDRGIPGDRRQRLVAEYEPLSWAQVCRSIDLVVEA